MANIAGFIGFPDTKLRPVKIPDLFFSDLLPQIDDLAELKLTLHCFWLLNDQSGEHRYLRGEDLRSDNTLLASLTLDSELRTPQAALAEALSRAVARNTLLRMEIDMGPDQPNAPKITEDWYFINTVKGRQAIALIRQGRLREVQSVLPDEARIRIDRPNVFVLYEQNIGVLTPLIAEKLRDIEKTYAPDWIIDAFEIAIGNNKRHLNYIHNILKRWETKGRDGDFDENAGRNSEERGRRDYRPDKYSDIILG
ncbi:MAG: DnaD domain protein [Caldilineaceae bacterium]|nr:DnaD domain protein [Caldilineaceae bacterium]